MLIYNFNKEFLGIDEHDLEALGFSNLTQLRAESADFANLFVKTPGYVHNFKHVHWIDFVSCVEGSEESKVIIHAKGKSYKCILNIKTAYLVDNPSEKAYLVNLQNLRALTNDENAQISGDLIERAAPKAATSSSQIFNTPDETQELQEESAVVEDNDFIELEEEALESSVTVDPYESDDLDEGDTESNIVKDIYEDAPIEIDLEEAQDETPQVEILSETIKEIQEELTEIEEIEEVQATQEIEDDTEEVSNYTYDPKIASSELGLPIDLIEEFIEDFIAQAKEFKDELYQSLDSGNLSQVKILSHKLKGVAANLRIEDAKDALVVINSSSDIGEVYSHLNLLYKIVAKLAGEELVPKKEILLDTPQESFTASQEETASDEVIQIEEDDEAIETLELDEPLELDDVIHDELIQLEDDEEPQIQDTQEDEIEEDLLEIEDIDLLELDELDIDSSDEELTMVEEPAQETITYDKNLVANEIGLDEDSFNELFEDFIKEAQISSDSISKAIEDNDSKAWKQNAIKLKGMSDNMRIDGLKESLTDIINTTDSELAKQALEKTTLFISNIAKIEE